MGGCIGGLAISGGAAVNLVAFAPAGGFTAESWSRNQSLASAASLAASGWIYACDPDDEGTPAL